jgi:hypothetical protein
MNNIPLTLNLHRSNITWQLESNLEEVDPFLHTKIRFYMAARSDFPVESDLAATDLQQGEKLVCSLF